MKERTTWIIIAVLFAIGVWVTLSTANAVLTHWQDADAWERIALADEMFVGPGFYWALVFTPMVVLLVYLRHKTETQNTRGE